MSNDRHRPTVTAAERRRAETAVGATATRSWAACRLHLRWRLMPHPTGGVAVRPVLDLGPAVVAVDGAMIAAWGVPWSVRRSWALDGARRGVRAVVGGPGSSMTVHGGTGTSAIALDGARLAAVLPATGPVGGERFGGAGDGVGRRRWLVAVGRDDRCLPVIAVPAGATAATVGRRRRLLAALAGTGTSTDPARPTPPGSELAIFVVEGPSFDDRRQTRGEPTCADHQLRR
ncbi:MAG: hypothetical protein AAGD35_13455 [Actinomycetota bacterium]